MEGRAPEDGEGRKREFPDLQRSYMSCATSFTNCVLTKVSLIYFSRLTALKQLKKDKNRLFF